MRRRALLAALGGWSLAACSPKPPEAPPAPRVTDYGLHLDPVSDLIAAGGLDWLVLIRWPAVVQGLDGPLSLLLPPKNIDQLSEYLGFDLRLDDEIAVAGFGATTLYLLKHAGHDPQAVEQRFRARLTGEVERSADAPGVTRVTGLLGSTRRGFGSFEPGILAFEVGKTGPLKAAAAFAMGKLKRAKPALRAEPLLSLSERLGPAPIRIFFPSPANAWQGAHGLLERASAAGIALTPEPRGLHIRALLQGAWDNPPTEALRRLEATTRDLSSSGLGKLTALDTPLVAYSYGGGPDTIHAEGVVDPNKLAAGLKAITSASLDELFPGLKKTPSPG